MCEITAIKSSTWSSVIAFEIEPLPYYDMKSLAYYIRMKVLRNHSFFSHIECMKVSISPHTISGFQSGTKMLTSFRIPVNCGTSNISPDKFFASTDSENVASTNGSNGSVN